MPKNAKSTRDLLVETINKILSERHAANKNSLDDILNKLKEEKEKKRTRKKRY